MKVKFLKPEKIEAATQCMLDEYSHKFAKIEHPPIPAEEILECLIGLELGFDDLPHKLGIPDVLGATWIQKKKVLIDSTLDPTINSNMEGRYRFTVGHELGHWDLHRHFFQTDPNQTTLFGMSPEPSIVCRKRAKKEPIEWQADSFAGYLLMPTDMVLKAWEEQYGSLTPYIAVDEIADLSARWSLDEDSTPTVEIARTMAKDFKVSGQAMQIRLIGLGLIKREVPVPGLFPQSHL